MVAWLNGCLSASQAEKRLVPLKSSGEFRLDDIAGYVSENPERAIHLIEIHKRVYGAEDYPQPGSRLKSLEEEAVKNLIESQARAVREKRWDDAASLARSLKALEVSVENTGMEPDFLLADAKDKLSGGNYLGAFLAARRAHELQPLEFEDALFFLEQAVKVRQRGGAAFFFAAAEEQGAIPEELRLYAQGRDTAADMVKGVATVLVDRGYRIEKGRGIPDWVLGSAFFVDPSGFLITNYHVISSEVDPAYEGYSRLYIRLGDAASPRIPARVIGWDKTMDLALIKAEIKPEYVFSLADRAVPRLGETIYAIGSPVGLEKTVTAGIVSAQGRRLLQIGDVIQIDAAVNHGNSGGPVVDAEGRLVGIVFAGIEQYQGLNFAVPAERLAAALPAMIRGGKAERPWLGLIIAETARGAEVVYVAPFTPAAEHHIAEGTWIKTLNDGEINAPQGGLIPALQDLLFPNRPGELVSIETSDGIRRVIMSEARPEIPLARAARVDSRERMAAPLFGIILAPTAGNIFSAAYVIKRVVRGSIADEAGLSEQDPVSIRAFRVEEKEGYALLDIHVKKRRLGYLETSMRLPAVLDIPDTL
ncbi:MAG: S1C family serine protease [Spirochaetaceae bacterium]|jgi:S1-C subfamily serine protease|nr:S1C family serine protease [Spirochaetaceae bacterium]